jgi:hypothetical protein
VALLVRSFPGAATFPGGRLFPAAGFVPVGQGHPVATATYQPFVPATAIVAIRPVGTSTVRLKLATSTIFALDQG